MIRTLAVFLFVFPSSAQQLEIGIVGAARATAPLEGSGASESRPYLVGPAIRFGLPRGFAVEADALYSPFGYTTAHTDIVGDFLISRSRAGTWQFPLLLKYRHPFGAIHPYALGGFDPQHASGTTRSSGWTISNPYDPNYYKIYQQFSGPAGDTWYGLVAGGGIELASRHWRVSPEVRYVRWTQGGYLTLPRNEVQIVLGVAWAAKESRR